eukprot:1141642-Pelagomonas_calceolata.AAC.1
MSPRILNIIIPSKEAPHTKIDVNKQAYLPGMDQYGLAYKEASRVMHKMGGKERSKPTFQTLISMAHACCFSGDRTRPADAVVVCEAILSAWALHS